MNKIFKLTVILFLVCAVVAGVLGVVFVVTEDTIAMREKEKTDKAYAAVLESDSYEEVTFDKEAFPKIDSVNKASNGEGHVVVTTFSGAQGSITLAVGVNNDYKCTGISIISHSETSGLGANAASTAEVGVNFRAQFVGVDSGVALAKMGGEIDALTGATITSRTVTAATANAIAAVESLG